MDKNIPNFKNKYPPIDNVIIEGKGKQKYNLLIIENKKINSKYSFSSIQ